MTPSQFQKLLHQYDYSLPPHLIAQEPAKPRTSARLLVYHRNKNQTSFDTFANIADYLPKKAVLVFNQTKVIPARLRVIKSTGGKVELLYLGHNTQSITVLSNRPLALGAQVHVAQAPRLWLKVMAKHGREYTLRPSFKTSQTVAILRRYGSTPLPPYIKHSRLNERQKRQEYQSVFARAGVSVAAPTASLHFSKQLLSQLRRRGIDIEFITLNVNLGTFAPLEPSQISKKALHAENYTISKKTATAINRAKINGWPVVAVGTTVVRALESAAAGHQLKKVSGSTRLFIRPGYRLQIIDGLITNFHVPQSSLLMLVAAITGRKKIFELYHQAIQKNFRFFSFGDGMLIL